MGYSGSNVVRFLYTGISDVNELADSEELPGIKTYV